MQNAAKFLIFSAWEGGNEGVTGSSAFGLLTGWLLRFLSLLGIVFVEDLGDFFR